MPQPTVTKQFRSLQACISTLAAFRTLKAQALEF